jgi:hypothetical protein
VSFKQVLEQLALALGSPVAFVGQRREQLMTASLTLKDRLAGAFLITWWSHFEAAEYFLQQLVGLLLGESLLDDSAVLLLRLEFDFPQLSTVLGLLLPDAPGDAVDVFLYLVDLGGHGLVVENIEASHQLQLLY